MSVDSIPWIEKYRPSKLVEIEQTEELIELFKNSISTKNIPHYLFYGPPGTGKTSTIKTIGREIFREHYPTRVIEFNASDDRGINAVREKITLEARKSVAEIRLADGTIIPPYKIVILDEADSMTEEAQDALRVIIEQNSRVTRFCFICNYTARITDAIKSRCSAVYFRKLNKNCISRKLKDISEAEGMKLSENNLETIIEVSGGDMRKAIMLLQNLKYLHHYKKRNHMDISELNAKELSYLSVVDVKVNPKICEEDIYKIAALITPEKAKEIIKKTIEAKSIADVVKYSKEILIMGYPVDTIMLQISRIVLDTKLLNDTQRAKIILYMGKTMLKIKESANNYIQLCDLLCGINGIVRGVSAFEY